MSFCRGRRLYYRQRFIFKAEKECDTTQDQDANQKRETDQKERKTK
jgi:hypothetical protein